MILQCFLWLFYSQVHYLQWVLWTKTATPKHLMYVRWFSLADPHCAKGEIRCGSLGRKTICTSEGWTCSETCLEHCQSVTTRTREVYMDRCVCPKESKYSTRCSICWTWSASKKDFARNVVQWSLSWETGKFCYVRCALKIDHIGISLSQNRKSYEADIFHDRFHYAKLQKLPFSWRKDMKYSGSSFKAG